MDLTNRELTVFYMVVLDNEWKRFRQISGVALVVAALLYTVLVVAMMGSGGLPGSATAMLDRIDEHMALIRAVMAIFIIVDIGWLVWMGGLFVTVIERDRALPALAWIVSAVGALLDIISSLWIFSFPDFSNAYAQADQLQSGYVPTAELFFTYVFRVETPFAVALQCLGVMLISSAMLHGPFQRWIAYLGLATGALGVVGALSGQIAALFLLIPWLVTVGIALLRGQPRDVRELSSSSELDTPG
jgi:hypothetical protein